MNISLKGKNAIVCGSTQGIGKAVALELASNGASVILIARNEQSLQKTKDELTASPDQRHYCITADFSSPESLKTSVENFLKETKLSVHILVNNTGGPPAGPVLTAKSEEFIQAFTNHLLCNHVLVNAVTEGMKKAGYGRIINIVSTSVKQPIKGLGVSNTIRGAVASWAKTLASELAPFAITVNNILPGATSTGRLNSLLDAKAQKLGISIEKESKEWIREIPLGRFAQPDEIANAVAFLASPAANYITGVSLQVDGGRTSSL